MIHPILSTFAVAAMLSVAASSNVQSQDFLTWQKNIGTTAGKALATGNQAKSGRKATVKSGNPHEASHSIQQGSAGGKAGKDHEIEMDVHVGR